MRFNLSWKYGSEDTQLGNFRMGIRNLNYEFGDLCNKHSKTFLSQNAGLMYFNCIEDFHPLELPSFIINELSVQY